MRTYWTIRLFVALIFTVALFTPAAADMAYVAEIEASADNTLIEHPDGALSNGAGPGFFAGRTNQLKDSIRRGVIYFDVAAELPADAIVEEVSLTLYLTQGNPGLRPVELHRLQDDWGEGDSFAGGGGGAAATPGDATWVHTFHPDEFWVRPGGQFIGRASATEEIDDVAGFYTWESTNQLVQDVRLWLHNPDRNFGWIVVGDETEPQTAKRFASRENPDETLRPVLVVTYRLPDDS